MNDRALMQQESPMKQAYDSFDVAHIRWSESDYQEYAMTVPPAQTKALLRKDWERRAMCAQNVICSASGISGSGKSSLLSACALELDDIYTRALKLPYHSFTVNNVYYEPEEMQERIKNDLKRGETLLKDEHLKGQAGMMSDLTTNFLTDAEQQLRKNQNNFLFASIEEEDHAHFFMFEMKHVLPRPDGYPAFVVAILKTPRYNKPSEFVWRGLIAFPFPAQEYWEEYNKRKDTHILKLKSQYGNTLTPVGIDAIKIYQKRHEDLISRTREGLIKPVKDELLDVIISDEIGTRKYTNKGYSILKTQVRDNILKEYAKQNEARMQELEENKERDRQERKELVLFQMQQAKELKQAKLKAFEEKLAEDKLKRELKAKALELREKEMLDNKAKKEREFQEKVEKKKKELEGTEGYAKYFPEDLVEKEGEKQ